MKHLKANTRWLLAATLITLATLGLLFVPSVQAADSADSAEWDSISARFSPDQRIFNEDLLVSDGEVINDNVAVLNGNVTILAGGVINGDLSVVRGNVDVAGQVRGNLAVVQGDASLAASARVEGDVSIVGGEVSRADGAYVGGNFVGGSNRGWRGQFESDSATGANGAPQLRGQSEGRSWLMTFFWRMVQAVLWTLLITGLVVLIVWLAPAQVKQVAQTAEAEPALSFTVGLIVSLVITFLAMGLFATICLAPAGFLLGSLLAIAGLLGWAATAWWIGEKLTAMSTDGALNRIPSLVFVSISALVLTGLIFFFWALVACIGFILGLLAVAPGVGGVLVTLARRARPREGRPDLLTENFDVESTTSDEAAGSDSPARTAFVPEAMAQNEAEADSPMPTTPTLFVSGDELGLTETERAALQAGAGIAPAQPADFTRLKGIGPTFDKRLKEAGITT
ncbi:MAG: hypothetical protein DWI57_14925, partial [Chloroflexi bacterium]